MKAERAERRAREEESERDGEASTGGASIQVLPFGSHSICRDPKPEL